MAIPDDSSRCVTRDTRIVVTLRSCPMLPLLLTGHIHGSCLRLSKVKVPMMGGVWRSGVAVLVGGMF
jgi:hypothetical protein